MASFPRLECEKCWSTFNPAACHSSVNSSAKRREPGIHARDQGFGLSLVNLVAGTCAVLYLDRCRMLQPSELNHHLKGVHVFLLRRELLPLPLAEPVDDDISSKADYIIPLLFPDDQRGRVLVVQL